MTLIVTRHPGETWRQAVRRMAGQHGLAPERLELFDRDVAAGGDPERAAWAALCEWDCLDYVPGED